MHVLILGASYGSLLATKLLLAGHDATLVCTEGTAALVNAQGTRVRLPVRGRDALVEVDSNVLTGTLSAVTPEGIDPDEFDLVVLAMQEPQYGSDGVRDLLGRVASAGVPAMAIMNMPPLPYLARLPGVDVDELTHCYAEPDLWSGFDPSRVTLASPDPQAFRPADEEKNVLQVSLPTNFKVAPFGDDAHTALLRTMQDDIRAARFEVAGRERPGESIELPVHVALHDSLYVPLAKWAMLISGNYACVAERGMISIREAVHDDLERSRTCYEWVCELCEKLGAAPDDMVPFGKYAKAAEGLAKPSSAARSLFDGAEAIERVDALVQGVARQQGMQLDALDAIVARIDARLESNRADAGRAGR